MVDIHTHVLWGLDDGAASLDESLAMLAVAETTGTTDIVATPHANSRFPFDADVVRSRITELQARAGKRIRLHSGCDFHVSFANVQLAVSCPATYAINDGPFLLAEFSEFIGTSLNGALHQLQRAGLRPIITHPERNPVLSLKIKSLEDMVNDGCYVQLTAQSLLGRFGKQAQSVAHECIDRQLAHFIASDAHDVEDRPPRLDKARDYVARGFGEECADILFVQNPGAVLRGDSVTGLPKRTRRFWWFRS
jgi:protein-tyrosine phosphatase